MKQLTQLIISVLAVLIITAGLAAIMGWYADRVYGDWTCAFARCVKVKP